MNRVVVDCETRSHVSVVDVGSYRYGADPSTELTVTGYAFNDEPVKLIPEVTGAGGIEAILAVVNEATGLPYVPRECLSTWDEFIRILEMPDIVFCAQNAEFELSVLAYRRWKPEGWFGLKLSDTAARARERGYPGKLERALEALYSPIAKDMEGNKVMMQTSRPRSAFTKHGNGTEYFEDPVRLAKMYAYNITDVEGQRYLDQLLPELGGCPW